MRGTRIYILATYAAALVIVLDVLHGGALSFDTEFLMLALIGAVMAPHTVHLGMRVEMSISHPFILATMILLGTADAVLISIICISSLCFIRAPRMEFYRSLFNISSFVVTTFATCHTYVGFGGSGQGGGSVPLMALMSATLMFYLVNTYSISGVVALSGRLNIFKVWHENFLWSAPSFFAGGSLALGMSYFLDRFGIYSFVLSLPFCVLIYYSYKLYLYKLEEKKQHLEDIERMNADLERKVKERTQELEIEDPALAVQADRSKIKQIMYNLLSNAVKFTPPGGRVTLRAGAEGDSVVLAVVDTGIGIKDEDHERIFQAFTQVDGSYARKYQGTGLGLTLVKKFVEMHGGQVEVTSRFGAGSTFRVTLPSVAAGVAREPAPPAGAPGAAGA